MAKTWIVGLGNPGKKYERTRHNAGFHCVLEYAGKHGFPPFKEKHDSLCSKSGELCLLMPQTFMNESGRSLARFKSKEGLEPARMLVVYDDMDLPLGKLRYRAKGSGGSHNGMASILECLGTQDFPRLRLGVGKPENPEDWADYVLKRFPKEEQAVFAQVTEKALQAMQAWAEGTPAEKLMSSVNA